IRRRDPYDRHFDNPPEAQRLSRVSEHKLGGRRRFLDERLADQFAADVLRESRAVENLLHSVRVDGSAQPELQRPPPQVRDQVAAEIATRLAQDCEKAEMREGFGAWGRHGASFSGSVEHYPLR